MTTIIQQQPFLDEDRILNLKKICSKLQSLDRKVRKQAYIDMELFFSKEDYNKDELRSMFCETHMYILNGLRDKSEAVRDKAISFLKLLVINKLPLNDFYLTYIFPILVERIGNVEIIEESEEIRLQLLHFLHLIILKYSNTVQLKPFLSDSILILRQTVKDKFPAIKEVSCNVIIDLAKALPVDFHMEAETLIKPVLSCLVHQRYKVRLEAVNAIGEIIMHSSFDGLNEVVGPLAEKLFDQIPIVRRTVAAVAARWLLEYRDRYSAFHKILPLLLTGLHDEIPETRAESDTLWEKVGLQYQQENEKDLKDELDYLIETPKYYPENIKRPNLGCRALVRRNVSKLTGPISRELTSWQEDIRVRCSQLLCVLTLHAEDAITQNLQDLLTPMYSAARDDDKRVVANIIQASELLGHFVKYDTWSKLVLAIIEDGPHYGHLTVLAGLVKGSPKQYISEHIEEICKVLAEDSICCSRKKNYQLQLIRCVEVSTEKYDNIKNSLTGYYLFKIIVTLMSLKDPEIQDDIMLKLFDELRAVLVLTDITDIWKLYTRQLLTHINTNPKMWTTVTDEACIFLTILSHANESFGQNLGLIEDILTNLLDNESDAEVRLKTFYVLSNIFESKQIAFKDATNISEFIEKQIKDVILPSLVWRAGVTSETIRTMAVLCLKHILMMHPEVNLFSSEDTLKQLKGKMFPLFISLLEDASYRTRHISLECLILLKEISCIKDIWSVEDLTTIYPEILKRLDDPTEKVRFCALQNMQAILEKSPESFRQNHYKAHHELIIDSLLTHFDDDDVEIQEMVFNALKVVSEINKFELINKIEKHRPLLRNQDGCDNILKFLED